MMLTKITCGVFQEPFVNFVFICLILCQFLAGPRSYETAKRIFLPKMSKVLPKNNEKPAIARLDSTGQTTQKARSYHHGINLASDFRFPVLGRFC